MLEFIFFLFFFILLIFSIMVIFTNHPVFSLIFLIASFVVASFLLFLIECEFLALIFVTIYVGAIAVFFLFSIMMLDLKRNNLQKNVIKFLPVGIFFGVVLIAPIIENVYLFFPAGDTKNNFYLKKNLNWFDFSESISEIEALGQVLYTCFIFHFLLIGIILLVVLIGVVHLTTNSRNSSFSSVNKNKQVLFKQLAKNTQLV